MSLNTEVATTRIVGRISREPQISHTSGGQAVCRLTVARKAAGPTSSPVIVNLYIKGDLARRCHRKLNSGELIEALGELAPMRRGARFSEVIAESVSRFEQAERGAHATA